MNKLDVKLSAIFGLSLFGTLYVISAIGLVTVGVYAILEEGITLNIKTPLWVGGIIFLGGLLTIGIALCGRVSYLQSLILLGTSGAIFILCFVCVIILEFVEKRHIFRPPQHKDVGLAITPASWRSTYIIYLVYLISSVVGLVSAMVGFLYIYCILIGPVRNEQWKSYETQSMESKNQKEEQDHSTRTKYTFKDSSPCQIDEPKSRSEREMNELPAADWIYKSQSIHSLATTPTRKFPINKETQLNKDVVEELQTNSTFKVHQYLTRPSLSPVKPVPPPVPPIAPSAGGSSSSSPSPTAPPPDARAAERPGLHFSHHCMPKSRSFDHQECTARSLEHYPIPRKYSLRRSSRRYHSRKHSGAFRPWSPEQCENAAEGATALSPEHYVLTDVERKEMSKQSEHCGSSREGAAALSHRHCTDVLTQDTLKAWYPDQHGGTPGGASAESAGHHALAYARRDTVKPHNSEQHRYNPEGLTTLFPGHHVLTDVMQNGVGQEQEQGIVSKHGGDFQADISSKLFTGEGVLIPQHQQSTDADESLELEYQRGTIVKQNSTFKTGRSTKESTGNGLADSAADATRLQQTPQQEVSHQQSLPQVSAPVKRKCPRLAATDHHQGVTLPGSDQVRSGPFTSQEHGIDCGCQSCLPPPPDEIQEMIMSYQFHVSQSDNIQPGQIGQTQPVSHMRKVRQEQQISEELQMHPLRVRPLPPQRSVHDVHGQESVWETEAVQMDQTQINQACQSFQTDQIKPYQQNQQNENDTKNAQTSQIQIHQIYQSSPVNQTGPGQQSQQNPKSARHVVLQDRQNHQVQSVTDPDKAISTNHHRPQEPVMPVHPKPRVQRQRRVVESSQRPQLPVPQRRNTRRVHERIQAMQEKLWEDSSIPVSPSDEVDHLQPRHAASSPPDPAEMDNIYVASIRL